MAIVSDPGDQRLGTRGAALLLLGTLILGGIAFVALIWLAPPWIDGLQGVVVLIGGFVAVMLCLLLGAVVLTALGMRAKDEALGMPPGSIRALIAMVLILIFAILGLIVFNAGTNGKTFASTGLTQDQIDGLRRDGALILQQSLQAATPGASPGVALYDVTIQTTLSRESHDFGLQLLTTVSTLVVAVAGFYFGSKTTEMAGRFAQANRGAFSPPEALGPKPAVTIAEGAGTGSAEGDDDAEEATPENTALDEHEAPEPEADGPAPTPDGPPAPEPEVADGPQPQPADGPGANGDGGHAAGPDPDAAPEAGPDADPEGGQDGDGDPVPDDGKNV